MDNKKTLTSPPTLISLIILALSLLVIAIIIIVKALNPPETSVHPTQTTLSTNQISSEIVADYDQKITAAETNEEKSALYDERADQLYSNSNGSRSDELVAQILADAYAAEALNPTAETASNIAKYETIYGDPATAAYYFQLAAERDPSLNAANAGGRG